MSESNWVRLAGAAVVAFGIAITLALPSARAEEAASGDIAKAIKALAEELRGYKGAPADINKPLSDLVSAIASVGDLDKTAATITKITELTGLLEKPEGLATWTITFREASGRLLGVLTGMEAQDPITAAEIRADRLVALLKSNGGNPPTPIEFPQNPAWDSLSAVALAIDAIRLKDSVGALQYLGQRIASVLETQLPAAHPDVQTTLVALVTGIEAKAEAVPEATIIRRANALAVGLAKYGVNLQQDAAVKAQLQVAKSAIEAQLANTTAVTGPLIHILTARYGDIRPNGVQSCRPVGVLRKHCERAEECQPLITGAPASLCPTDPVPLLQDDNNRGLIVRYTCLDIGDPRWTKIASGDDLLNDKKLTVKSVVIRMEAETIACKIRAPRASGG